MRNWLAVVLPAGLAFAPFTSVLAQEESPTIEPGARVRIHAGQTADGRYGTFVGTITRLDSDSLALRTSEPSPVVVSLTSLAGLEVSRGRKSHPWEGATIGLVLGAATGAIIGFALGDDPPCQKSGWFACWGEWRFTAEEYATMGAVVFGAIGILVGRKVGANIETERWQQVPLDRLRVSFVPQRGGRFAFAVSVAF
ncbi:MAG: hypothetical protein GTN62_05615 [Gemmatimonadales bacterium]|nr:hypothetical protein [Gemmatimonadales bacterium]NIN10982.1 hypothetical protein [Gemmatimonadales bacterium]NIN49574.1 hypothetical protein [Gemmatimonadales bacterium]NIP07038.1 hypothetical protein [Gemmatimonadales bacterium]NIR01672.1 hypothetical protein [Gemmatimonadales bacterium]